MLVRQAHPGERRPAYRTYEQKLADARDFREKEQLTWDVLVDDLDATVHRAYGGMSDPVYVIDADGRVGFYGMWIDGPRLGRAIEELLAAGGRATSVAGGVDRRPHMASAFAEGARTLSRGGVRAVLDLARAFPFAPPLIYLGYATRPLTHPLVARTKPLPLPARIALGAAAGLVTTLFVLRRRRGR